jgi:hypothetical protein
MQMACLPTLLPDVVTKARANSMPARFMWLEDVSKKNLNKKLMTLSRNYYFYCDRVYSFLILIFKI